MADAHLGAFSKNPVLKKLNIQAFEMAIDKCIAEEVDFIIIAGDLFHNPIPDMDTVKRGVEILKKAQNAGIRIYMVYGSHDFSAGSTSLLDVLNSADVFMKAVNYESVEIDDDTLLRLKPVRDETGVYIVGISGLSSAAEVEYFQYLDRAYLSELPSPKIFVFHTTISELKPSYIPDRFAVPKSSLPQGFDYYAGGHIHARIESSVGNAPLIYPGPLFGATYSDLERGYERGFYIVEDFKPKFVRIDVAEFERISVDANGKSAVSLREELMTLASKDYSGKVVMVKVSGELYSGKIADVDFHSIREKFKESALEVLLNTYQLKTRERKKINVAGGTKEDIEREVFKKISVYGEDFTHMLFRILSKPKPDDMKKRDYEDALWREVYDLLNKVMERENTKSNKNGENQEYDEVDDEKVKISEMKKAKKMQTLFDFYGVK